MRLALVANPDSGRGVDADEVAQRLLAYGAEVLDVAPTPAKLDTAGAERLAVAAGDGMIGPCAELAGLFAVPLAVIAAGTANDFARDQGLPRDLEGGCRLAATGVRLRPLELARMEIGGAHARPFVNVASGGLAPVAARRARPLKRRLGPLAYPAGAIAAGLTAPPFGVAARADGRNVFDGDAWQVIVASTGAFGGGSDVEEADPHDGRLDLVAIPAGRRRQLPRRAWGMRRGTLATQDGVVHERADVVELDVAAGTPFNVDGEVIEVQGAVRFDARRDAFELVVG